MVPNVSSLNFSFQYLPNYPHFSHLLKQSPNASAPRRASFYVQVSNSRHEKPTGTPNFGEPTPAPWLVDPPAAPPPAPSIEEALLRCRANGRIPFSLRLVQLKRKSRRAHYPSADLGAFGNAVRSLASVVEEIHRSVVLSGDKQAVKAAAWADAADSISWLFGNVFCTSPGLAAGLLVLMADFLTAAIKKEISAGIAADEFKCWSDIGILEECKEEARCGSCERRKMAYEKIITSGITSSLIMSNYAQLLYQYEKDIDRANYYFKLATTREPRDAEAMSRYASFLWRGAGDLEAAEEMFLKAIDEEPENYYHQSSYVFFLRSTGGVDVCFPLEDDL
ncbi:hypothetical protein Cni_G14581 [Canna indica]|uniref:Uncharacterized protein n=1 Tax=Canna indica TaxID=4628 RepID=A0AAQ3QEW2_9LILI|nr:hypothetical protein Cni_G14581 [Canna indica]